MLKDIENIREKLTGFINEFNDFAIAVHESPDGDCLGAAMFLYLYLKKRLNKNPYLICDERSLQKTEIKRGIKKFCHLYKITEEVPIEDQIKEDSCLFVVDHHDQNNSVFTQWIKAAKVIIVDHHFCLRENAVCRSDLYIRDEVTTSTCSLLMDLFNEIEFTKPEALFLHLGIWSDNLGYKRAVCYEDIRRISKLAEIIEKDPEGPPYNEVQNFGFSARSWSHFLVEHAVYSEKSFYVHHGTKWASVSMTPTAFRNCPSAIIAQGFLQYPHIYTVSFLFWHGRRSRTLRIYTRDKKLVDYMDSIGIRQTCKNYYYKQFDRDENWLDYLSNLRKGYTEYLRKLVEKYGPLED